ncbi:MAG TPA: lipid IV(A) 3-deoxy-D-manno-octulosonic acid transferase [Methylophilaceae bacterium]|nr:lipid IV(A) 3-deoxy-D-manno-octulosonic acid transferase [Methylophilaceae bacterium]
MNRLTYILLIYLLLPLALLKLLWRAIRQPEYLQHVAERFGFYPAARPRQPLIWLHAVSVGETRAAAPLVALLRQRYPGHAILLTHTTPTGRAASEQLFGDSVLRGYLPYDLPGATARFLRHFQPRIGLLMETELWFNLIAACGKRGIPLLLVNARLSEKSARGYARLGRLAANGLGKLTAIAAQTEADATRLRQLSAPRVSVMGNLKFDVTPPPEAQQQGQALRKLFGAGRPVFLAASTRDGEEALVLDAVQSLDMPELLTVIVPRHPQRFDAVAALLQKREIPYLRRSEATAAGADCKVVLGDSMGEMFAYYAACDIAFIGGSLLPLGGQNLIEACAMGKPVLIGPHTFNFAEAATQATQCGAARRVPDEEGLARALAELLADASQQGRMGRAGLDFSAANRGAAQRATQLVGDVLGSRG